MSIELDSSTMSMTSAACVWLEGRTVSTTAVSPSSRTLPPARKHLVSAWRGSEKGGRERGSVVGISTLDMVVHVHVLYLSI